jgi:competence protein ComEC
MFKISWRKGIALVLLAAVLALGAYASPKPEVAKALQIYFVDVEGGQATLFVTPERQSLLIDTGWQNNDARDAERIVAAAKDAGIAKIDFVLITHFHDDHVGGVPQLVARIPVGTFIDHGENRETGNAAIWHAYQQVLATGKYKHIIAKRADVLPIQGIEAMVLAADGAVIEKPLPGAGGANAACASKEQYPADQTENARSLGTIITFGKLRILDLGDLTSDKETQLMCPVNKVGPVDIFVVSHHGSSSSNSPALVHGVTPRVAIMDNGAAKGGAPSSWNTVENSPGLEDLWQLHFIPERSVLARLHTAFSKENDSPRNVPAPLIANLMGPDAGNYLKLTAQSDGSFEIYNSRTKATKKYPGRDR